MTSCEIPQAKVLVTGARIRTEAVVKIGCVMSGYSTACPKVSVWVEDKMLVWINYFDQISVWGIKGDVTISTDDLLRPTIDPENYREHVINMILKANIRQVRFDFGKVNECKLWFNNLSEKPSSSIAMEPINKIWDCFKPLI